jgi:hypothetical protein
MSAIRRRWRTTACRMATWRRCWARCASLGSFDIDSQEFEGAGLRRGELRVHDECGVGLASDAVTLRVTVARSASS